MTNKAAAKLNVQAGRVLATRLAPYLTTPLLRMVVVESDQVPTAASDARWRFYYNPAFMEGLTPEQAAAIWLHEVSHCLRGHSPRWNALAEPNHRHPLFNVAGDAGINADVSDITPHLPGEHVTFDGLRSQGFDVDRGMSTEQIYRALIEKMQDESDGNAGGSGSSGDGSGQETDSDGSGTGSIPSWDCGSAASGDKRPWEKGQDDSSDGSVTEGQADLVRQATAAEVAAYERSNGRGSVPAGMRRWAESLLSPSVDWRTELRSVLSRMLGQHAGKRDYSYSRPSRRRVPGVVLPAMTTPPPPSVTVVVDTSGSMGDDDLAQALSDIAALTKKANRGHTPLRVLSCDTAATEARSVRSLRDVEFQGGGGTDMRVGMEAAAAARPKADVIITITDGDTEWPSEPPAGNPSARYLAVITRPSYYENTIPHWMKVIRSYDPELALSS